MDDGPGLMPDEPEQSNPTAAAVGDGRPANGVPSKRPRGRPTKYGYRAMRRSLSVLTTKRLDGRSAVAVAVRRWKDDVRCDLGRDLTRAQETILEAAAQAWIILASLDDYIARQPSLVTRKRQVLPVVLQRMQIAEGLARNLERLGLERRAKDVDVAAELAALHADRRREGGGGARSPEDGLERSNGRPASGVADAPSDVSEEVPSGTVPEQDPGDGEPREGDGSGQES